MKSEQKNKRRGRSPTPKKKLKRKYRNDRSKKAQQSSSDSSSSEDASLTSDEYPSSGEERRKEAKKKRSKNTKHKSRASVSSSRSPSPEKAKKKSKQKDNGEGKKEKYKKERKYSPSPKKKRKQSSDSEGSSDDSIERSPVKKEKPKKKQSPSPVRIKKKRSVSPPTGNGSTRFNKKKESSSPIRSKKKASPSPPSKDRRSRSPSPVKKKKNKSPLRQKKSVSPSPSRIKKGNASPHVSKHKSKSRSPPPRIRKRSSSPPSIGEKKITSDSRIKSKSPLPNRHKKQNQSPSPVLSPPSSAPKKERRGSASRVENKPSHSSKVDKKMKVHGPALPASTKSLSPLSPSEQATSALHKNKNNTGDGRKQSASPIGDGKKSVVATEDVKKKKIKEEVIEEVKKKSISPSVEVKKERISPTEELKKKNVTPLSGSKEFNKKVGAPLSAKEIAKKVIAKKSDKEMEKKVIAPKLSKDVEKIVNDSISVKEMEKPVSAQVCFSRLSAKVVKKVIAPILPTEIENKVVAPRPLKELENKVVSPPGPPQEVANIVVSPLPPQEVEKKVVPPLPAKGVEKKVVPLILAQDIKKEHITSDIVKTEVKDAKTNVVNNIINSTQSVKVSNASIPLIGNVTTDVSSSLELKPKPSNTSMTSTSNDTNIKLEKEIKIPSFVKVKVEVKEEPGFVTTTPVSTTGTSNILATVREASSIKIKSPLVMKKKITIAATLNVLSAKEKKSATSSKKDEDSKTTVNSPSKAKTSSIPTAFRSRKRSASPTRNRKKSISPVRTRKRSKSPSPRTRKRSKSPRRDRKRSRSRSPVRYRKDDKQRKRSRSGSPEQRRKDRDRSRSPDKDSKKRGSEKKDRDEKDRRNRRDEKDKDRRKKDEKDVKGSKRDKSPEKKDITELEEEMKKRKERIEAWRNANRKKGEGDTGEGSDATADGDAKKADKKWSLEDDDSEDEEQGDASNRKEVSSSKKNTSSKRDVKKVKMKKEVKEEEEVEDDDPLDSFMKSIDAEVNKLSGKNTAIPKSATGAKTKTITVVKTVTVNKPTTEQVKPEVMEQNQDALEYSSEEEEAADIKASDFTEATKKRKELTVADHTMIYYAPFRKNFYMEVPELARMNADEVKLLRETLGDIQVRGKNTPKPIKTWAQAGLSSKVMSVLKRCEYEKPTPIQAQALPVVMSGRDMIGIAKTGSGKTLAFVLPMLRHVLDQPALDEDDGPLAIIMTPTRELALQIYRESKKFCKVLNLNVTCIYGGSGISEQIAELKKGTEIIVCTPGRMIDMLAANNGRVTNCRRCTFLVMDEADRMFDMGFEPQVMRIIGNIRPDRQTVLFSATFPRQMEAVARKVLTKPIEVQVGGRSIVCSDVEQHAIVIEEDNKFFKILELLGVYQEQGSILLFVERQETADGLFKDLLKKGYPCLSLHGGMDQFDRDSTIADFKNSVTKLMVSTSVAARGLDVKNLNLVVNFDCPNHYEDYVHRVGRTGRAGNKGTAFTFVTPEQGRSAGDVVKAFDLSKCAPPEDIVALWTTFKEDMEKEGKSIKMNSGFTGTKGFKFNAEEDAMVNESKKMRKFTLGLQDSDEEAEAADDAISKIEADLEKAFSSKPKIALQPEVLEGQKVKIAEQNVDKDKLKQASNIAALINKKLSTGQVVDRNTAATAHIMQGGALESLTGVGLAKQLADKVNAKLNYKAAAVESEVEEKPIAVRYEEEIDINDFPQQARWRITSKEIIEQVREVSEAGVTVRGIYIPPNKKPTEEERRLHLYIESLSERSIQIAKAEIKRLLKDELLKSETNSYRPQQPTGRYKVL